MSAVEYELAECRVVAVPGGLAQAGVTYDLPGAVQFRIRALAFKVATAAGGGFREVLVELLDSSGAVVFAVAAPGTQSGNATVVYSFAEGVTPFGATALGAIGGPFVGGRLPPNLQLVLSVANAESADAITDARLLVEQHPVTVGG